MIYRLVIFFSIFFLAFLLISCGGDEVQAPPKIIGEWKIFKRTILTDNITLNSQMNDAFAYSTDVQYLIKLLFKEPDFNKSLMVESSMAKQKDPSNILFPYPKDVVYKFENDSLYMDEKAYSYTLSYNLLHLTRKVDYIELFQMLEEEAVMGPDQLPPGITGILKTELIRIK